jgi:hypothetical protein
MDWIGMGAVPRRCRIEAMAGRSGGAQRVLPSSEPVLKAAVDGASDGKRDVQLRSRKEAPSSP